MLIRCAGGGIATPDGSVVDVVVVAVADRRIDGIVDGPPLRVAGTRSFDSES